MKPTSPRSSVQPLSEADFPTTAMVFAAGLGTRMRPLTDKIPKPLVSVAGKALIDYALDDFAKAGVTTAIVNVHHLADQIERHLSTRASPRIILSDERASLLDQGGGIKKVLPLFEGRPFFICNTDAFWKDDGAANFQALARAWDGDRMDAALLLAETKGSVGVDWDGDFELQPDGRVTQPPGARRYVYSGVGIVKPRAFRRRRRGYFQARPILLQGRGAGAAVRRRRAVALAACRDRRGDRAGRGSIGGLTI